MTCKDCGACEQPRDDLEWTTPDGVFVKMLVLDAPDMLVPQHSHVYAHTSLLVRGAIRAWRDGFCIGDFRAPHALTIPANAKHTFLSLEPDTAILCIHRLREGDARVPIAEEHQIAEGV